MEERCENFICENSSNFVQRQCNFLNKYNAYLNKLELSSPITVIIAIHIELSDIPFLFYFTPSRLCNRRTKYLTDVASL
uniref:Uncharacterized protein n=1 Tax=Trichogramma kaykai TaxID=54128 RepID=A0ABD2W5X4_9HYME